MRINGKTLRAAILIFDVLAGLLLFAVCINRLWEEGQRERQVAAMSAQSLGDHGGGEKSGSEREGKDGIFRKSAHDPAAEKRKIALTFDDGPHPYYTEQLLDGLKERGVKVTFFVTGEHAALHPDVILQMHEEGHLIGNHTYSHMQLRSANREKFKKELLATNEVIGEITGEEVLYVRPPYGTWDKSLEEELSMFPVLWTIDPLDWCSDDVGCIVTNVVDRVEENDIILMHDYYESSVTAALEIVDELQEEGYVFATVEEILFE